MIFDPVGASVWKENTQYLAPGGRLLLIGVAGGGATETAIGPLIMKDLSVLGVTVFNARAEHFEKVAQLGRRRRSETFNTQQVSPERSGGGAANSRRPPAVRKSHPEPVRKTLIPKVSIKNLFAALLLALIAAPVCVLGKAALPEKHNIAHPWPQMRSWSI